MKHEIYTLRFFGGKTGIAIGTMTIGSGNWEAAKDTADLFANKLAPDIKVSLVCEKRDSNARGIYMGGERNQ